MQDMTPISHLPSFYLLVFQGPYSEYKISVKAFTWKNEGDASESVTQRTDIAGPSPPIVVNLTCHNQTEMYLRWKRPLEYYNTIDFYIIVYREEDDKHKEEIRLNASATHLETAVSYIFLYFNCNNTIHYIWLRAFVCWSFFLLFLIKEKPRQIASQWQMKQIEMLKWKIVSDDFAKFNHQHSLWSTSSSSINKYD